MRRKSLIALLLFAVIFVTAGVYTPYAQRKKTPKTAAERQADSIRRDSLERVANDTTRMDSLQRAIYRHNKQVDDSIRLDSINRQKKNGIDAPVVYSGNDSLVYNADSKMAYLSRKYTPSNKKDFFSEKKPNAMPMATSIFNTDDTPLAIRIVPISTSPYRVPRCVRVRMSCSDPPIWWWPTCHCRWPFPTVFSPLPRNTAAALSCLLTATRANAAFTCAT